MVGWNKFLIALATLVSAIFCYGQYAVADIILSTDETIAHVNSRSAGIMDDFIIDSGTGATATASVTGITSTTSTLFSNSVFAASFSQDRGGEMDDFAFGMVMVDFSVTVPTTFKISANYTNSSDITGLEVGLSYLSGDYLFRHMQQSFSATTLTAGISSGAEIDFMEGSTTGLLLPGWQYRYFAHSFSQAPFDGGGHALADGVAFLEFELSAIPEPSSIGFFIASILILFVRLQLYRRGNQIRAMG